MANTKLHDMQKNDFKSKAQIKAEKESKSDGKLTAKTVAFRIFLSIITLLLCVIIGAYALLFVLVNGGCQPLKERLVLSATQASATKWLPGLFMPQSEVDRIVTDSLKTNSDIMTFEEYASLTADVSDGNTSDEWANAKDGMIFK